VGGRLLADEAHIMLDQDAGIDLFWQRSPGSSRVPIAVRYQNGGTDWRSFTLRNTEIVKFGRAITDGEGMRPVYMIQTYLDRRGRLLSTAMGRIDLLMELLPSSSAWRTNPADGKPFKAVFWDDFRGSGIVIAP
jgi:hypothetical protein